MKRLQKLTTFRLPRLTYLLVLGLAFSTLTSSCRTKKEGCAYNEKLRKQNVDKNGNLSTKSGDSNLFSKKMRKRSGR